VLTFERLCRVLKESGRVVVVDVVTMPQFFLKRRYLPNGNSFDGSVRTRKLSVLVPLGAWAESISLALLLRHAMDSVTSGPPTG
jgi:hypothetical protein